MEGRKAIDEDETEVDHANDLQNTLKLPEKYEFLFQISDFFQGCSCNPDKYIQKLR